MTPSEPGGALEEALTLHRLNVFPELVVSFKITNLIESQMARLDHRVTTSIAA